MKRFPLTTLISLYELLKNSRLIDRYRSTTKKPHTLHKNDQSHFGVEPSDATKVGGG
jgi:hypothetical protein